MGEWCVETRGTDSGRRGCAGRGALVSGGAASAAGSANTWMSVGSLATGRAFAVSGLLTSGKVIVAGGASVMSTGTAGLASTEIFDPTTSTWSAGPAMTTARVAAAAVTLPNGDLFIAGGGTSQDRARA